MIYTNMCCKLFKRDGSAQLAFAHEQHVITIKLKRYNRSRVTDFRCQPLSPTFDGLGCPPVGRFKSEASPVEDTPYDLLDVYRYYYQRKVSCATQLEHPARLVSKLQARVGP